MSSRPSSRRRSQTRSTSVWWRIRPSRLISVAGSGRNASCSPVSPAHLCSRVERCQPSQPSSMVRSSATNGSSMRVTAGAVHGCCRRHTTVSSSPSCPARPPRRSTEADAPSPTRICLATEPVGSVPRQTPTWGGEGSGISGDRRSRTPRGGSRRRRPGRRSRCRGARPARRVAVDRGLWWARFLELFDRGLLDVVGEPELRQLGPHPVDALLGRRDAVLVLAGRQLQRELGARVR